MKYRESTAVSQWLKIQVSSSETAAVIKKLKVFTKYDVMVQGFTSMGDGDWSSMLVSVTTDEAGKVTTQL